MKITELSIGDWVQARMITFQGEERLTPPMRVVALGETWVWLAIDPEQGDPFDEKIEDIRPVPLTADILMANGWVSIDARRFRWESTNDDDFVATVSVEMWNDGMIWGEIWTIGHSLRLPVPYVHKLQQALHLAGIEKEIEL